MRLLSCLIVAFAIAACEASSHTPDTKASAGTPLTDTGTTDAGTGLGSLVPDAGPDGGAVLKVDGCGWVQGSWTLTDCTNAAFDFEMHPAVDCGISIVSAQPVFAGAIGKSMGNALLLQLLGVGSTCMGAWNGAETLGWCLVGGNPCAFKAVRK